MCCSKRTQNLCEEVALFGMPNGYADLFEQIAKFEKEDRTHRAYAMLVLSKSLLRTGDLSTMPADVQAEIGEMVGAANNWDAKLWVSEEIGLWMPWVRWAAEEPWTNMEGWMACD